MPSIESTRAHDWAPDELAIRERNKGRLIYGTADHVVVQLRELADAYGTDEVMINLMLPGETSRLNALTSIAHWLRKSEVLSNSLGQAEQCKERAHDA
ncbi:hypothetical protein D3C75_1235530 [compost metagenome]